MSLVSGAGADALAESEKGSTGALNAPATVEADAEDEPSDINAPNPTTMTSMSRLRHDCNIIQAPSLEVKNDQVNQVDQSPRGEMLNRMVHFVK